MAPWLKSLLASLLLIWAGVVLAQSEIKNLTLATKGEKRVALVIGNSAYVQGPLRNPVNDARAMTARLRTLGFEVIFRENLKTREIGSIYRDFRTKITPGGTALVFYAGHGLQVKGQNYFPAVDSSIDAEEDVPLQSLNLGTLLENMEEAKAGVSLVFLDACRDNPFARRFRGASRGLAKVETASGTLIHYATKPGSVAADGTGKNGTYTEALLAQMNEPDVPVELMLKKVANRVVAETKGKQEPWIEGSLRGDFYFRLNQGISKLPAQMHSSHEQFSSTELVFWNSVEKSNTYADYAAYVKKYPEGQFVDLAQLRIKQQNPAAQLATARPSSESPKALAAQQVDAEEKLPVTKVHDTRVALVIGNSNYKKAPLENPANDASDLAYVLEKRGFNVIVRENVGERGFKEAVETFAQNLKKGGVGLFFFAGHGVQLKDQNFMLPVDFVSAQDIASKSVSAEYVLSRMAEAGNRASIVILDASRQNPFQESGRNANRGLAPMLVGRAEKGTYIAYATSPGSIAPDGTGRNGLYVKHLLEALEGEDTDIDKVFGRVRLAVVRQTNGEQVPWTTSSLVGSFYFDPRRDLTESQRPRISGNTPLEPTADGMQVQYDQALERAYWDRIKDSKNPADYNGYIEKFPGGPRTAYARWMVQKYGGKLPDPVPVKGGSIATPEPATNSYNLGEETNFWRQISTSTNPADFRMFLERYPQSPLAQFVRMKLEKLSSDSIAGTEIRDCPQCPNLVVVREGEFEMGSLEGDTDEKPVRKVKIGKAFALGATEVTRQQWRTIMEKAPPTKSDSCNDCPVENVSWNDVQDFLSTLSRMAGKSYRLPSEAEWEYACRAGGTDQYCGSAKVESIGWIFDNSSDKVQPVAQKASNAWGLFDMTGNVWEWTEDCWNGDYVGAPMDGSAWVSGTCSQRVLRGGSWFSRHHGARATIRHKAPVSVGVRGHGFRVARTLP